MHPEEINPWFGPILETLNLFHARAHELGFSPLQLALGFVHNITDIDRIVVGVNTLNQLREVVDAVQTPVNSADYSALSIKNSKFLDPGNWELKIAKPDTYLGKWQFGSSSLQDSTGDGDGNHLGQISASNATTISAAYLTSSGHIETSSTSPHYAPWDELNGGKLEASATASWLVVSGSESIMINVASGSSGIVENPLLAGAVSFSVDTTSGTAAARTIFERSIDARSSMACQAVSKMVSWFINWWN